MSGSESGVKFNFFVVVYWYVVDRSLTFCRKDDAFSIRLPCLLVESQLTDAVCVCVCVVISVLYSVFVFSLMASVMITAAL